ncbi:MAG TPA: polysaccharide deacetylase family protein [Oscillatoriaceae cyanobacterium M33_DOE_052]|uniref:Polysaccharide deacetylase family protein n=1 Tax=Planktothricoides sp. SpSt-374 TaxID=2282167 RepID=A0A7C3ZIB2_9CYAN|nr:polysaccharide deacetylase family protein [Oscillatoriaceae cyanobacterium M33_DOE_052]
MATIDPSWYKEQFTIGLVAAICTAASATLVQSLNIDQMLPDPNTLAASLSVFQLKQVPQRALPLAMASEQRVEGFVQELATQQTKIEANFTFNPPKLFQGKTIEEVPLKSQEKVIALTFDDGPWKDHTDSILKILQDNDVKGTFFFIGQHLQQFPEQAKRVVAAGHAVANHTWNHHYHNVDSTIAAKEIGDTNNLMYKLTGAKSKIFRPPGGVMDNGLVAYAHSQNYVVAMWSSDAREASGPTVETLVNNVVSSASPGGIVLMHDGGGDRSTTVAALPIVITQLRQQGYKFVTLPQLFTMKQQDEESFTTATPARPSTP